MTVIVAARTRTHGVVMAADAQISYGWQKTSHIRPKVWVSGQYVIGASGCLRTAQVIQHHADLPRYRDDEVDDVEEFLVKEFVPAVRKALDGKGLIEKDNGIESTGSSLLVAWGDQLAEVCANGAVIISPVERMAIGSGYAEALGALGDEGPWTRTRIVEAARRATITASGCSGSITVVDTKALTIEQA